MARMLVFSVVLGLVATSAGPQENPDLQAKRLLEDGRTYRTQGKLKQAVDNFNMIVESFPQSDSVGQALLEIGRHRMEVEGDAAKARAAFETVTKQHAQSDAAPGAYYYLGVLTLNTASSPVQLDDALAQFTRLQRLYPRSEWVPMALQATGLVHRRAGRLGDAIDVARRASLEYPTSVAAPPAQFLVGLCLALQGESRAAMEEFQQVRNRFPESPWSATALDRTTALYRLFGSEKPSFAQDPSYSLNAIEVQKDVRGLLMMGDGTLWISSARVKAAIPFDAAQKMGPSLSAADPGALSLSPQGDIVFSAGGSVREGARGVRTLSTPTDRPGETKPLEEVVAAAVIPGGALVVSDLGRKQVLRFDAQSQFKGPFVPKDTVEREVTRILVDSEGAIVMLDRKEKTVRVYDDAGQVLRSLGPTGLRRPADIAVDPFRNIYVADEELGVLVFSPKGQLLATIAGGELKRPKDLTLDPSGAILVWDDRVGRILRYR